MTAKSTRVEYMCEQEGSHDIDIMPAWLLNLEQDHSLSSQRSMYK